MCEMCVRWCCKITGDGKNCVECIGGGYFVVGGVMVVWRLSGGPAVRFQLNRRECEMSGSVQMGQEVEMAGGKVSSSKVDMLHLIPTDALTGLADRFAVGSARKGDKAWNATTNNHEALEDREFLLERVSHVIRHALLLRDQIVAGRFVGVEGMEEDSFYENAGAVAFGGALMLCAAKRIERVERMKEVSGEW